MSLTLLPQKASSCFLASADVTSAPFTCTVGDVSLSLSTTSLTLANSNVAVFSSNLSVFTGTNVALPTNIKLVKDPSNVVVRFGNNNILKAPASRFSPTFSNGSISFLGSGYTNPTYQPSQVFENPATFTRDVSAPNITTLSNAVTTTTANLVALSNLIVPQTNWSSNALFPKTGGTLSGSVMIAQDNSYLAIDDITSTRMGFVKKFGYPPALMYTSNEHLTVGALQSSNLKEVADKNYVEHMRILGNTGFVGIGTSAPQTLLDVNGTITATAFAGPTITSLGNTSAWSSNALYPKSGGTVTGDVVATGNVVATGSITSSNLFTVATPDGDKILLTAAGGNASKLTHGSGWTVGVHAGRSNSWTGNIALRTGTPSGYADRLYINNAGNIGVNTNTPSSALDVNGTINATSFTGPTITALDSKANFSSNTSAWSSNSTTAATEVSAWSSNNLFNKNTGGSVSGNLVTTGTITANAGPVSVVTSTNARYRLYNNGSTAEWAFGQKDSTSHNFVLSKVVSGTESDYVTVDTSGNLEVAGEVYGSIVGATSYLTAPGGTSSGGLYTALPSPVDGANFIPGDTAIGRGGITVVNGVVGDVPEEQSNSALWVNGGITASQFLRVGTFALGAFTVLFPFTVTVGTSGSATKTQSGIQFWEGQLTRTMPTTNYHAIISYKQDGVSDTFVGKISDRTTTSLTLYTTRVNGGSWATSVEAFIILYAK